MKVYLAGPDIFRPDAECWMSQAKELCKQHGLEALTPLDHGESEPNAICRGNLDLIRKAQMVIANLNPFRGVEPDSGTAFELGYALALGKKLWGYMEHAGPLVERIGCAKEGAGGHDRQPVDAQGLAVEDFGLPLNLMLAASVQLVEGNLTTCLEAIRPRATAGPTPETT